MARLLDYIARGTAAVIDAARKMQSLQVRLTADEIKDGVEHFEPYGFTSNPQPGAEAVLGFVAGDRSHCIAIVVADRRFRLRGLQPGEVALFTDEGDTFVFKRGRRVELTTKDFVVNASGAIELHAGTAILLDAPQVHATANVKADAQIADATSSMQAMRDTYNGHDHAENDTGGPTDIPNQQMI